MSSAPSQPPLGPTVIKLALPFFAGLVLIASVSLADAFFVARLGSAPLAAFSFTLPITGLIQALFMGLGQGITSLVSRTLGEGRQADAARYGRAGVSVSIACAFVTAAISVPLTPWILGAQGASEPLIRAATPYFITMMLGLVAPAISFAATAALRARGEMASTVRVMALAAVANILLAPALIFGLGPLPGFGMLGAGCATLLAYVTASLLATRKLRAAPDVWSRQALSGREWRSCARDLLRVGGPAAVAQALLPAALIVLTRGLAEFGDDAVAAVGVFSRMERIVMMLPLAVGGPLAPIVGLCWGRQEYARAAAAVRYSLAWIAVATSVIALGSIALHEPMARVLLGAGTATATLAWTLTTLPLAYPFASVMRLAVNALTAIGHAAEGSWLYAVRGFIVLPAALMVGGWFAGLPGALAGAVVSEVFVTLVAVARTFSVLRVEAHIAAKATQAAG